MLWRIWYEDVSSYCNLDGSPENAPYEGVVAIVQHNEKMNRVVSKGWNYYYWRRDEETGAWGWCGADQRGQVDQFARRPHDSRALKIGWMVGTPRFEKIMEAARSDPDFRPQSAGKNAVEQPID